jgi:hypothetical protein
MDISANDLATHKYFMIKPGKTKEILLRRLLKQKKVNYAIGFMFSQLSHTIYFNYKLPLQCLIKNND